MGGPPLRQPGGRHLGDYLLGAERRRLDTPGARGVTNGSEPHGGLEGLFAVHHGHVGRYRQQHPVALEHHSAVGVVQRRQHHLLIEDVLPDIEFRPVGQGKHPDVLALAVRWVVQVPQLGSLDGGIPLAELVPEAEDPLLGPGLLLVVAGSPEHGVETLLLDGPQQGEGLQAVAAGLRTGLLDDPAGVDVVLHAAHHQANPHFGHGQISEDDHVLEVVPGVDVHDREGQRRRPERLRCHVQHDDRILATGEEQDGPLEAGRHLPEDVHRLCFQGTEMGELVGRGHRGSDSLPEM